MADAGCDVAVAELLAEWFGAVAAIGEHFCWLVPGVQKSVDQWDEVWSFVFVAGADTQRDGQSCGIYREVELRGRFPTVDGAFADLVAPFFASIVTASTTTRDQSIRL